MSLAYDQVLSAVEKHCAKEEHELQHKMQQLRLKCPTIESLGCDPLYTHFVITDKMRSLIGDIESRRSGLEKVNAMKSVLNEINEELSRSISKRSDPFNTATNVSILPDDLVAAVIHLLLNCESTKLLTNIRYIQNFSWYLPTKNELGYSLVTFQVALEYIRYLN